MFRQEEQPGDEETPRMHVFSFSRVGSPFQISPKATKAYASLEQCRTVKKKGKFFFFYKKKTPPRESGQALGSPELVGSHSLAMLHM